MAKPLIGITTQRWSSSVTHPNTRVQGELHGYIDAVLAAGGLPVLIPLSVQGDDLRELYGHLDGVILPGGGDLEPALYQAPKHPTTNGIDLDRDQAEIWLARQALSDQKPLLGICRGLQVLNVAAGGSLIQDLPSERPEALPHYFRYPAFPLDYPAHNVQVEEESLLARVVGAPIVEVNSRHHQAMQAVAPGLAVVGRAPDGVIEAVESPTHPFALAVQWHPENLQAQPAMRALFERFVAEAARRARPA
jgi:putative glutamine amidotransferase